MIGQVLGPYRIESKLGEGGMGEVYRARDTRLDRVVAIKVLPSAVAGDPERRARFEREAKAVAALSHPNILAIHDVGQHDGIAYVVTELLQGETLRARIDEGALPIRKVVQIGADIADGLAAAHDKGIVHRDLKPENVFVTADGRVKILDFGLARQVTAFSDETSDGQTVPGATDPGTVMGTVGYMAPEQVTGQPADSRADIFALGCVLYEMASGRRAFARPTAPETMTAILRDDAPEIGGDPGTRPAAFDGVVRHCLEKRPAERFQSARDLAFALRSLAGSSTSGGRALSGDVAAVSAIPRRTRTAAAAWVAVAALGLVLVGRYAASRVTPARPGPQAVSFEKITDEPGIETSPSLSPDGKSVVYAKTVGSDTALYVLRVGSRRALRLSGSPPARDLQPAFSPDGDRIAFRSGRDGGGVFLMSATGESVTRLTGFGYFPSWSPDGTEIVVCPNTFTSPSDLSGTAPGLSVVDVATGHVRALPLGERALQPRWSPNGARIAYFGFHGRSGQRDIRTIAADGSDARGGGVPVTDDAALDWSPAWSPDGRFLYFSSTRGGTMNVWRVPIDQSSGHVLGEAEPMTTPSTWSGDLSFSRDGTRLAFASVDYRSTLLRMPFDAAHGTAAGPPLPTVKGTRPIRDHALSPDGQWLAFTEAGGQEDLFVARIDGTEYRRLTDDAFRDRGPAWSPDGTRIAFYSDRSGDYELWTIRPDGSGLAPLTQGTGNPGYPTWSPDGTRIAFGYYSWHLLDTRTSPPTVSPPQPVVSRAERFIPMSWSRDGERIAGRVNALDGSVSTLAVFTLSTGRFDRVPGDLARVDGSFSLAWLADGRRLVLRRPDGVAVVDAVTGAGRLLIQVGGEVIGKSLGVSRDDRWITYTETATEGDVWVATIRR